MQLTLFRPEPQKTRRRVLEDAPDRACPNCGATNCGRLRCVVDVADSNRGRGQTEAMRVVEKRIRAQYFDREWESLHEWIENGGR